MIAIEEDVQKLIGSTDIMAKETFEDSKKMREFLKTLSDMYNTSYNNILLLKSQRENINFVASKEDFEKYKYNVKEGEKPLKIIKRIKTEEGVYKCQYINEQKIKNKNVQKRKLCNLSRFIFYFFYFVFYSIGSTCNINNMRVMQ